jgi:hypothetical protein
VTKYNELLEAVRTVDELHNLDDAIYDVRARLLEIEDEEGSTFEGSSWDHPRVLRYSEAVGVIRGHLDGVVDEA